MMGKNKTRRASRSFLTIDCWQYAKAVKTKQNKDVIDTDGNIKNGIFYPSIISSCLTVTSSIKHRLGNKAPRSSLYTRLPNVLILTTKFIKP